MKDFFKYVFASITGYLILMVLFTFIGIMMLVSVAISGGESPEPVKKHSVLKINLSGEIVERKKSDPLSELPFFSDNRPKTQGLDEIIAMVDKAAKDNNVDGIYLNNGALSAGMAKGREDEGGRGNECK